MGVRGKHFFQFGPFRLDPDLRLLFKDGVPISIQPKAFDILLTLVANNEIVVLKQDLMAAVWPDAFVEESNLTQNIFVLRKILGETAGEHRYIVTVPGRGYRFAAEVAVETEKHDSDRTELEKPPETGTGIESETRIERRPVFASRLRLILGAAIGILAIVVVVAVEALSPTSLPRVLRVRQVTHIGRVEPYSRVVTDGTRLYFTEMVGGTGILAEAPIAGGEPRPIATSIPNLELYDIDRTGSKLLIGTQSPDFNNPLWVVPTSGGSGQRLSDVLSSEGSAWTTNGRGVVYGNDEQIFRIGDGGGEPERVLRAPGFIASLRLSPDGNLLRFTVQDSVTGGKSLWEATSAGANLHPVSLGWKSPAPQWGEGESYGEWTPDGKYYVFRAARDGTESFWVIREKGSRLHRGLSAPVQLYVSSDRIGEPRFSRDGKKLFFVSYQERRELVRYDSTRKLFVPYLGGTPARLVSFSPDGKWVSFRSEVDGSLWRSRVDGTERLQLTFSPMVAYHSCWSADGKSIVFGGSVPGTPGQLYSVPYDGGKPQVLAPSEDPDGEPSCSPDGRFVAFLRWTTSGSRVPQSAAYILDLETRRAKMIPGTQGFEGMHWSPDGKYAAASDQVRHRLMLFDFVRQTWSELSDGAPYGWGIRWSSDSRYVYYQHWEEGEAQPIYRVRIRDRKIEQITSASQIPSSDVLSYTMTGLTPDNEPLATLVHKNSDVYVLDLDFP